MLVNRADSLSSYLPNLVGVKPAAAQISTSRPAFAAKITLPIPDREKIGQGRRLLQTLQDQSQNMIAERISLHAWASDDDDGDVRARRRDQILDATVQVPIDREQRIAQ